ncbi:Gfo/Idh/MocA family protein [Phycicoccus sonneratiae]|uniref:Gfo/Idh/MocA family oxidoreductase n=1 Tax=Phycicoccus sonneratiae TaxID=2807628 RepID=A0ABS2CRS8_9MICO|nr:Gfo/Idh/MocA family oxidoreductase [Phycicoccus sonneraticus]MBM6402592.1 Gfo/Idh/MocA family oxidoreductase [Phycicoccus sonneraticus]
MTALPSPRTPDSGEAPPLRWGVLGTGWIADRFVGSVRRHTRQVVAAVGSRTQASADDAVARWGAGRAHGSYEALVADPEVDVVYVATPHNVHLPHALLAIGAGKHVLVEKPVGLDADEARAIGEAAAAAGVFCMEAMWTLFLPRLDVVRQLLEDGVLGEPTSVLADMGEWFGPQHRIFRDDLAGGPLLDLGTYPVTLATWVLGAPDTVTAVATPAPTGINGQLSVALGTASGATAALQCSILADTPTTACIAGPEGRIELHRQFYRPGPFTLHPREGAALRWDEPRVDHDGLHFEAAEVARRITAGETGSPLRPWADTVATLEVMDRVRAATGLDFAAARAARNA